MIVDHAHHIEDPNATTPQPQVELVGSVPTPPMPDPSETMTIHVTLPPGSAGSPPHRHTGPAFGYVIEDARDRRGFDVVRDLGNSEGPGRVRNADNAVESELRDADRC